MAKPYLLEVVGGRPVPDWRERIGGVPRLIARLAEGAERAGHDAEEAARIAVGTVKSWARANAPEGLYGAALAAVGQWEDRKAGARLREDHRDLPVATALELGYAADAAAKRLPIAEGLELALGDGARAGALASAKALVEGATGEFTIGGELVDPEEAQAALVELRASSELDRSLAKLLDRADVRATLEEVMAGGPGPPHNRVAAARKRTAGGSRPGPGQAAQPKTQQPGAPQNAEFDQAHPRGPGGMWIKKGDGMAGTPDQRVVQAQNRLTQVGYAALADGRFGPRTDAAVKNFQTDNGLAADGVVGPQTTEALRQATPRPVGHLRPPAAPAAPATAAGGAAAPSAAGAKANEPANPAGGGAAAGTYGDKFRGNSPDAVKARGDQNQQLTGKRRLVPVKKTGSGSSSGGSSGTGASAGGASGGGGRASTRSGAGRSSSALLTKGTGVGSVRSSAAVKQMQEGLDLLGFNLGDAGADGRFGPVTERAVKMMQRRYGLKADGIVGPQTQRLLARLVARSKSKKTHTLSIDQEPTAGPGQKQTAHKAYGTRKPRRSPKLAHAAQEGAMPTFYEIEEALDEAMAERMAAAAAQDSRAFTQARGRENFLRDQLAEATLSSADRKALPKSAFVFPDKAPGPGSYPIHDHGHRVAALARAKGKGAYGAVKAAVCGREPGLPACSLSEAEEPTYTEAMLDEALDAVEVEPLPRELAEAVCSMPHGALKKKGLKKCPGCKADLTKALEEAADSLVKASTPEPFSKSKTSNWVARAGGLPNYVQHIAHDLVEKRGKSESQAIQMAIGIVKRWCKGGGNVDATTRAAACKASAEWEAKKAKAHAS